MCFLCVLCGCVLSVSHIYISKPKSVVCVLLICIIYLVFKYTLMTLTLVSMLTTLISRHDTCNICVDCF